MELPGLWSDPLQTPTPGRAPHPGSDRRRQRGPASEGGGVSCLVSLSLVIPTVLGTRVSHPGPIPGSGLGRRLRAPGAPRRGKRAAARDPAGCMKPQGMHRGVGEEAGRAAPVVGKHPLPSRRLGETLGILEFEDANPC